MADSFDQWLAILLANAQCKAVQCFTVCIWLENDLVVSMLATATCVLQQAQKELEGVLTELEMDAVAVEPLAFVGQPQACLLNRSIPFAYLL